MSRPSPTAEEAQARHPGAVTVAFGDSRALSGGLLALGRAGRKTATCGALSDFEAGEAMPGVGRRHIAPDRDGRPAPVIGTTEVTIRRFRKVEADFAPAEGGDRTLEGRRQGHRRHVERNGGRDPEMALVRERFRLAEDFA